MERETTRCPACGGIDVRMVLEYPPPFIVQCLRCARIFALSKAQRLDFYNQKERRGEKTT